MSASLAHDTRDPGEILLREAFRHRAVQALEHIARSAGLESLARALESPTDFGAVAWALGHATIPAAALDLDPIADAVSRGVTERERLTAAAGGLLSAADLGRALGISRQAVDKRRRANTILAVRVAGDWRYPANQVAPSGAISGTILGALPEILAEAATLGLSSWAALDFLTAPDPALSHDTPLAFLARGETAPVKRLLAAMKADAYG